MAEKPAIAFDWLAACGGCEEATLDLAEELTELLDSVTLAHFPMMTDSKLHDLEARADGSLTAALISGCVLTEEHAGKARLLRRKSRTVVAMGACAHLGGVPGLANQADRANGTHGADATNGTEGPYLPPLAPMVRTLDQVIAVDLYVPGCPPAPSLIAEAVRVVVSDEQPPRGTVLGPDVALCDECPRKASRRADILAAEIRRLPWTQVRSDECLLNQGILCFGPGTRGGCGAACINANMPCTGCFGPTSRVRDHGAKLLAAAAAICGGEDLPSIERAFAGFVDPVGSLYRYSLPGSPLRGRRGLP
jgi:F420-non-reducing hydrogenase small subunit